MAPIASIWVGETGPLPAAAWRLLATQERRRFAQIAHLPQRHQSECATFLLRLLAAQRVGIGPERIEIDRAPRHDGEHPGKPRIEGLSCSVSHSAGIVAVAVSGPEHDLGLDVERIESLAGPVLPELFLTDHEQAAVASLPLELRPLALAQLWTRKEAVVKYTGQGMMRPFAKLDTLSTAAPLDLPQRARLCSITLPPGMVLGLATADEMVELHLLPPRWMCMVPGTDLLTSAVQALSGPAQDCLPVWGS